MSGRRRRDIAEAGHTGDEATARAALADRSPSIRSTALGALERMGALGIGDVIEALTDVDPSVRVRAAEAAAAFRTIDLRHALADREWAVVEMACWAAGEHEQADSATLDRLIELSSTHNEALVREAAVAALGAIGDPRGLPAIIAATGDKATVRRRAAVALAPFDEPEAEEALRGLLSDRDWQARQVAEDLLDERHI